MNCKDNEFLVNPRNCTTKYIISLDNIDLNLMPMKIYENNITSYQEYDEEFHSFEIYTEYTGSAFDDIKTSVCYICAVEVPRMFYQEHLSSAKHKMFACLAANTMKRLQLQVLQPMPQVERTINSIYYCASCSIAVKRCNRDEHELSTQHMNCVKNDELLKQLSDIMYIESDNDKMGKNIHDSQHLNCKTDLNATMTDISNSKINTLDCPKLETVFTVEPLNTADRELYDADTQSEDLVIRITAKDVAKAIKSISRGKSPGHDGLSIEHLQHAGPHLPRVLAMLFTLCVGHSYLPAGLMRTVVVPIIKNKTGDSSDKTNYRPISLATVVAKVFDGMLNEHLNKLITPHDN
ncbi:uncharacterized protein LOC113234438 [Hyposmocoma kahamanoa]|uniref:uncharacterized protein LOC113234438 n=1 Tax=Hyposmocoma kahamanoa TaxID=1477025 RepID=UPI000E6D7D01|nr:uncharacterized protein LOC113234438 [Hyposmocoma kahamanoa]